MGGTGYGGKWLMGGGGMTKGKNFTGEMAKMVWGEMVMERNDQTPSILC